MTGEKPVEREIKLAVSDLNAIEERLRALRNAGARYEGLEQETNVVLDTPDGTLAQRLERLRLRTIEGKDSVRVTWKGPGNATGPFKQREEQEFHADAADICATVFLRLGFKPVLTYRKERATWHWQGLSIMLDRLEFGSFVEIEVTRPIAAEDADRLIATCRDLLGLQDAPHMEASYADMQEEWDRDHR